MGNLADVYSGNCRQTLEKKITRSNRLNKIKNAPAAIPARILAKYMCQTSVDLLCNIQEHMNGNDVSMHTFLRPNLSIRGPTASAPGGKARVTMLAIQVDSDMVILMSVSSANNCGSSTALYAMFIPAWITRLCAIIAATL